MNYTIDTHSAVKILEEASFNEKQAEAIVSVVTKLHFANTVREFPINELATKEFVKNEIQSVRTEIQSVRVEIQSTKAETLKWMFGMFFVFSSAQLGILMIILKSFFKGAGGV